MHFTTEQMQSARGRNRSMPREVSRRSHRVCQDWTTWPNTAPLSLPMRSTRPFAGPSHSHRDLCDSCPHLLSHRMNPWCFARNTWPCIQVRCRIRSEGLNFRNSIPSGGWGTIVLGCPWVEPRTIRCQKTENTRLVPCWVLSLCAVSMRTNGCGSFPETSVLGRSWKTVWKLFLVTRPTKQGMYSNAVRQGSVAAHHCWPKRA